MAGGYEVRRANWRIGVELRSMKRAIWVGAGCSTGNKPGKGALMTAEVFAAQIELLVERARAGGLPDEAIIERLEAAAEALGGGWVRRG